MIMFFLLIFYSVSDSFGQINVDTVVNEAFGPGGWFGGQPADYGSYTSSATFTGSNNGSSSFIVTAQANPSAGASGGSCVILGVKGGVSDNDTLIMSGINTNAYDSVKIAASILAYDGFPQNYYNVQYSTDGIHWTEMDESQLFKPDSWSIYANWGRATLLENLPLTSNLHLLFTNHHALQQLHIDDIMMIGYKTPESLSADADLASLSTATSTLVPAFDAATTDYTVELPFGSTSAPTVTFVTSSNVLSDTAITEVVNVSSAIDADRTWSVELTAQNGITKKRYNILFNIETQYIDTLIVNTGKNYVLIPQIPGGNITITASSSDDNIVEVTTVDYTNGNNFAIIEVVEKGVLGSATISVNIDGTPYITMEVVVTTYRKDGINFEIHDAVFWQEVDPLNSVPVWETIALSGQAPYGSINWDLVPITVGQDCQTSPPCTEADFFTTYFRGYLVPSTTGDYSFYLTAQDAISLKLSTNSSFGNLQEIIYRGGKKDNIGTDMGNNTYKSEPVTLHAGQIYAIGATNWVIHTKIGGISWEGPGISKQYIPGENLMYFYDPIFPTPASNLTLETRGVNYARIAWTEGNDDVSIAGYNVYVDGIKVNSQPIKDTHYKTTTLTANTKYSITVTCEDKMGNESEISNIINVTTHPVDAGIPDPPTSIVANTITSTALDISWSGASDAETEVVGYNLYIDGTLYNQNDLIYDINTIVLPLQPKTSYGFQIEAVDAGGNISPKSSETTITTSAFNPSDPDLGTKTARIRFELSNYSRNEGIGINGDFLNGDMINIAEEKALVKEMEPSIVRWGALTANPLSFSDHTGTNPVNGNTTLAQWMDYAIENNAYCGMTCGVQDSTDWMLDEQTFAYFLEYLAGDASTTWGAIRASEGYTEPLLQKCKGLIFEFGNEVWGGKWHNAEIGSDYVAYGEWCREMATIMKHSPYYDTSKIFLVYSGRYPHPDDSYGLHKKVLTGDNGEVDWMAVSGYLGGNLDYDPEIPAGESELDYYKNGIARFAKNIEGLQLNIEESIILTGERKPTYLYESNMTRPSYNGRLGQAVVMLDYMTTAMEYGSIFPAIFSLSGGEWRITQPANGYKQLPLYIGAKFFNKLCKGTIMETTVETNSKIHDYSGVELDFDPVGSHFYTNGTDYSILLVSRDFENDYLLELDLPDGFSFNSTAKKYLISGSDFSTYDATIDSSDITLTDDMFITLPKHSIMIIKFTGEDQNFDQLPPGWYGGLKAIDSVRIIANEGTEIDEDAGYINLSAEVYPAEAITGYKWSFVSNEINALGYPRGSNGFRVKGSGDCQGNGSVLVKVESNLNSELFDTIRIEISNQTETGGCEGTSVDDLTEVNIHIFPNPVNEVLSVRSGKNELITSIKVLDLTGKELKAYSRISDQIVNIPVINMPAGTFLIEISTTRGVYTRLFIKQ